MRGRGKSRLVIGYSVPGPLSLSRSLACASCWYWVLISSPEPICGRKCALFSTCRDKTASATLPPNAGDNPGYDAGSKNPARDTAVSIVHALSVVHQLCVDEDAVNEAMKLLSL